MAEPRVRTGGQVGVKKGKDLWSSSVYHHGHFKQHQNSLCHVIDTICLMNDMVKMREEHRPSGRGNSISRGPEVVNRGSFMVSMYCS